MRKTDSEDLTGILLAAKYRLEVAQRKQAEAMQKVAAAKKVADKAREALLHNIQSSVMAEINALEAAVDSALFPA